MFVATQMSVLNTVMGLRLLKRGNVIVSSANVNFHRKIIHHGARIVE
jgi:hypothetical protein